MIALATIIATALALGLSGPWWLSGALAVPGLMWAPGSGWARWLRARNGGESTTGLAVVIDACWLSAAATWLDVALVRTVGLRGDLAAWGLLVLTLSWWLAGTTLARGLPRPTTPRREWLGGAAVVAAVLLSAWWRQGDLLRPLDGYWWLEGAADEGHEILPVEPALDWQAAVHPLGWPESGAVRLDLPDGPTEVHLRAAGPAHGRIILAVRGPLGSQLTVGDQHTTVQASVMEQGEEAPVRRYLDAGTAALAVDVDMETGEELAVQAEGARLYLLPGTEAVWSAHADGELRYTHYWQILNQVENLDWAREVLDWRWFTLNQPPGWSPLLATTLLFGKPDLPANNLLFLGVITLVGLTGIRLGSVLAPRAPPLAWLVPPALVAVHALLMFEPGSTNFPDSLYAAAVLAVALALAEERHMGFALLGIAAGLLRWPGVVLATLLALAWRVSGHGPPWRGLVRLWALAAAGAVFAAVVVALGGMQDLLFILWFETFPEHWHADYSGTSLLPRIPDFYLVWLRYAGGAWLLALLASVGRSTPARRGTRFLVLGALAYSTLLCTIDHHPTHYFLPLVALCGPMSIAASDVPRAAALRSLLPGLILAGLWVTLRIGQTF